MGKDEMEPKQSWYAWLEDVISRYPNADACAAHLGINASMLSRMRGPFFNEPSAKVILALSKKTQTPLIEVVLMVHRAVLQRKQMTAHHRESLGLPPRRRGRPKRVPANEETRASTAGDGQSQG
jgi:hypothetical protein